MRLFDIHLSTFLQDFYTMGLHSPAQWQEKKLDGVSDYLDLTSFQHFPENEKKNAIRAVVEDLKQIQKGQSSLFKIR